MFKHFLGADRQDMLYLIKYQIDIRCIASGMVIDSPLCGLKDDLCSQTAKSGDLITVGRDFDIDIANLPWPVSILKFNQVVHNLRPGDNMIARTSDTNLLGNLRQLLGSRPDLHFDVSHSDTDYRIRVTKI